MVDTYHSQIQYTKHRVHIWHKKIQFHWLQNTEDDTTIHEDVGTKKKKRSNVNAFHKRKKKVFQSLNSSTYLTQCILTVTMQQTADQAQECWFRCHSQTDT